MKLFSFSWCTIHRTHRKTTTEQFVLNLRIIYSFALKKSTLRCASQPSEQKFPVHFLLRARSQTSFVTKTWWDQCKHFSKVYMKAGKIFFSFNLKQDLSQHLVMSCRLKLPQLYRFSTFPRGLDLFSITFRRRKKNICSYSNCKQPECAVTASKNEISCLMTGKGVK